MVFPVSDLHLEQLLLLQNGIAGFRNLRISFGAAIAAPNGISGLEGGGLGQWTPPLP